MNTRYITDKNRSIIIRCGDETRQIITKSNPKWEDIYAGGEYDEYARAIAFGEGCWEDLRFIDENEAVGILINWGVV